MPFPDVMAATMQLAVATETLAAVGAQLALQQSAADAPHPLFGELQAVSSAAGLTGLDELEPQQQAMLAGMIRLYLHQAIDLVDHPDRAPGWTFTDPAILDGMGRGSAMIPAMIAGAHPDLAAVNTFLDVGTGVGLLAIAAAGVWPDATVVGIDPWEPSLARARTNVASAGLGDRITLRPVPLDALDETDAYDCAWVPTFFLTDDVIAQSLPPLVRAMQPGGWIVLGINDTAPNPLADATTRLRWARGGGSSIEPARAIELLGRAGCTDVHVAELPGPAPLDLVLGRRASA